VILDIKDLSVAFTHHSSKLVALNRLNFRLIQGKTTVLLGESGCGKSLTSAAIMRLLPHNAIYEKSSHINLNENDLLDLPEFMMRQLRGKRVAIIFQEPMTALNPVMTVAEQIKEVLDKKYVNKTDMEQRILALLNEVEMPEPEIKMHRYPHQLSGGQKQRVMIAMALAGNPELLIADEPTTALDVTVQAQILTLLKKLQLQHKMSILLITHDLAVAQFMADEVCVMYLGEIVEIAPVEQFFTKIMHPYVQQLMASIPTYAKRAYQLPVVPGIVPALEHIPPGCRFHPRCVHAFSRCKQEKPELQKIEGRLVRCHLYPQTQNLNLIQKTHAYWPMRKEQNETVLSVKGLCVHYSPRTFLLQKKRSLTYAVDNLSFTLQKGKTLALVGESGCGKTTTSRAILRLIPGVTGEIIYRGQSVMQLEGRGLRSYRQQVQLIFQDPFSAMNPRMMAGEIIAEGMHAQGLGKKFIHARVQQLLDMVHLSQDSSTRYPHQFSGGQRQRICIARALATNPEILICDEPTSALDISVQAQILNLIKELQLETGVSCIFITHNLAVVSYLADEILVMKEGKMVEQGSTQKVLSTPQQPYTQKLLAAASLDLLK